MVIGLAANCLASGQTHRRFIARLAAVRAAGHPASLGDLQPPPLPGELNVAAQLAALAPRWDAFAEEQQGWEQTTPLGKACSDLPQGARPAPEHLTKIRDILARYADLERSVTAAAACPKYASTADFSLDSRSFLEAQLAAIGRVPAAARLVRWRTAVLVADGLPELAVKRWTELLRLATLHEEEPFPAAQLESYAARRIGIDGLCRALAAGPLPPDVRERLDAQLARADALGKIGRAVANERAFAATARFESLSGGRGPDRDAARGGALDSLFGWLPMRNRFQGVFDPLEKLLTQADRTWTVAQAAHAPAGRAQRGPLADLLVPACEHFSAAARRDAALVRSLRIQNALQRYAEQRGREPAGLVDLGLPPAASLDPYADGPLIVRPAGRGWLTYSVGPHGTDDGGRLGDQEPSDIGLGPLAADDAEVPSAAPAAEGPSAAEPLAP